jgi:peptidyl-prolyl cis-trans isomerase SurA
MASHLLATRRSLSFTAIVVVASMLAATARAQQVVPPIDGELITELEIEQRSNLTRLSKGKTPSREEVITELRNEKLRVREAKKFGLEVANSEVDEVYVNLASRMRLTAEQLTQQLARSGVDVDTLRHRIRADIAWQKYQRWRRQDPPLREDPPLRDRNSG